MKTPYDDIINLPHHVSATRPHMSMRDRAAQFSPFAALTGYDAKVKEAARITDSRHELDDTQKEFLNERLRIVQDCIFQNPEISITYFSPDKKKDGGSYVTVSGRAKKIDSYSRLIVLCSGATAPIDEIIAVEGDIFREIDSTI